MSVIVRGMGMPKSCEECNFCVNGFTDKAPMYECACESDNMISVLVDDHGNPFNFRPDWCPLLPLPSEHGELIGRDALEPKRGKWIHVSEEMWKCDQCGEISCCSPNFCPDCGAKMKGDAE